jgi:hypothetical protein
MWWLLAVLIATAAIVVVLKWGRKSCWVEHGQPTDIAMAPNPGFQVGHVIRIQTKDGFEEALITEVPDSRTVRVVKAIRRRKWFWQ